MLLIYAFLFLVGLAVGSFLNVCIFRIPEHQDIVFLRSHCPSCGRVLKWYEMVPVASYLFLRGKCGGCGMKISIQYPLIELLNGSLWVITFLLGGITLSALLYCLAISALIVLSVIDFRTYEIPLGINLFILAVAIVHFAGDIHNWKEYLLGFICISGLLLVLFVVSKGRAIGGGDVKLMAAAGLLLGIKLICIAFLFGCLYGSVIHFVRMKVSGQGNILAMGPYLSMGIVTALWFGGDIAQWYLSLFII